jgi:hypothetical protein
MLLFPITFILNLYFINPKNDLTSKLAPPTNAPSMSGCDNNSLILFGLTLPPY